MAYQCDFCGKAPHFGNKVSHANNKTRRRWMPNLKRVRIVVNKATQTVRICTRCIRTGNFLKAA